MSASSTFEALAVIETASIARGFVVLDAVVKKAPVTVKVARPVSPGRFLLVFGGGVEVTLEGVEAARSVAGSDVVDELFLAGAHPALLPWWRFVKACAEGSAKVGDVWELGDV